MRLAGRVALGLVGLALVGSLALVVSLPRLVELSGVRERLVDWTQTRFGRNVSYEAFSVGFFPPRIEVTDLVVGAALDAGAPAFRAPSTSLALAWRRLLTGSVEIDSVVIDGADLRIVRTAEGVDWLAAGVPALPAASARGTRVEHI